MCILSREISTDPSGVSWANPDQVLADPVGGFPTVPFAFRSLVKTAAPYMEIKWSRDVTNRLRKGAWNCAHSLTPGSCEMAETPKYSRAANFTPAEDAELKEYVTANYEAMFGSFGGPMGITAQSKKAHWQALASRLMRWGFCRVVFVSVPKWLSWLVRLATVWTMFLIPVVTAMVF